MMCMYSKLFKAEELLIRVDSYMLVGDNQITVKLMRNRNMFCVCEMIKCD